MKKLARIKATFDFDISDSPWTSLADFEHWVARNLARNEYVAERIQVLGSDSGQLEMFVKSEKILIPEPKQAKISNLNTQFKNLKVK